MKTFIRKLSIKERKGFINSIIYSLFSFIYVILTKYILYRSKISFITLLFISGSILIIMGFYRIIRLIKKFKSTEKENIKINFIAGFNSFLSYFFLTASIASTSLTNITFITRLYPYLIMLNNHLSRDVNIPKSQLVSFLIYIFSFLIIFFPALYRESGFGVFFCLLSIIFKFSSLQYLSKAKGVNIDLLMLNIGFYNAFFGGIIVIITFDQIEHIGKVSWILIILNALTTYFMKIFLNKVLKGNSNNEIKLMILNVLVLIFVLPFDFYVFGQTFYYNYLVLIFSFVDFFFFYKKVKKFIKSDRY